MLKTWIGRLRAAFPFGASMRFHDTGKDGHTFKIRGEEESVSGMSYRKSDSSGFTECFGIGEGYLRLKNTATASLPASPDEGALIWDSTDKAIKVWDGSQYVWVLGGVSSFGYEEGTWTPTLTDESHSDSEGQTYLAQTGTYTRIGNKVEIEGEIFMSSLGTLTSGGTAFIDGLPYAAASDYGAITIGGASSLNLSAGGVVVVGKVTSGETYFKLNEWDGTTGTSSLTIGEISANGSLIFSGSYKV